MGRQRPDPNFNATGYVDVLLPPDCVNTATTEAPPRIQTTPNYDIGHYDLQRLVPTCPPGRPNRGGEKSAASITWEAFEPYLADCIPVKIASVSSFRSPALIDSAVMRRTIPDGGRAFEDARVKSDLGTIIQKLNIPAVALDALVTVQCALRGMNDPFCDNTSVKFSVQGDERERRSKRLRLIQDVDDALTVAGGCHVSKEEQTGSTTCIFLGQEDQVTTQMSLRDVFGSSHDRDRLQVCVAQETIFSTRADVSQSDHSSIVCRSDGTIAFSKSSSKQHDSSQSSSSADGGSSQTATPTFPLESMAPAIRAPSFLLPPNKVEICEVNFWFSPHESCTNTHYDGNHNILMLLHGTKTVELSPPGAIRGSGVYSEHANHPVLLRPATLSRAAAAASNGIDLQHEIESTKECRNKCTVVVSVSAGEALFIPEGWWHRVESSAMCIAVNFWFDHAPSSVAAMTRPSNRHMLAFQARELARRYVENHFDHTAKQLLSCAAEEYQAGEERVDMSQTEEFGQCVAQKCEAESDRFGIAKQISDYAHSLFGASERRQESVVGQISNLARRLNMFLFQTCVEEEEHRKSAMWLFSHGFPNLTEPHHRAVMYQIVTKLEPGPCYILSQVWERHASSSEELQKETEASFERLFANCGDDRAARSYVFDEVETFKRTVAKRLLVDDLLLG